MIFIFDWGHQTENIFGPLSQDELFVKVSSEFVNLVRVRSWFRTFFIPTIPTSTRYFLVSDENKRRIEISKTDFVRLKPLAELNSLAVKNDISEDEYNDRRSKINLG